MLSEVQALTKLAASVGGIINTHQFFMSSNVLPLKNMWVAPIISVKCQYADCHLSANTIFHFVVLGC